MAGRLTEDQKDQLETWIDSGPKTFKLIYSITRNECSAHEFHRKCDNQGPTVTVLYNQEGSVYGGYAGISWQKNGGYMKDERAFIFQLMFSGRRVSNTFRSKDASKALRFEAKDGPCFGNPDLLTFTGEVAMFVDGYFDLNGKVDLGNYFEDKGVPSRHINNGHMRATEIEVYSVNVVKLHPETKAFIRARESQCSGYIWRNTLELTDETVESLRQEIREVRPKTRTDVTDFRLLLIGHIGAGKSSFINTAMSAFSRRVMHTSPVGTSETGLTKQFIPYQVRETNGSLLQFHLCDTPGLGETSAMDAINLHFLLDGHIPPSFEFSPSRHMSAKTVGYISKPALAQEIHSVALVLDASTVNGMSLTDTSLLNFCKRLILEKAIPFVVILTKIDKLHEDIADNLTDVFKRPEVNQAVEKVSEALGIPPNHVFPVKNYYREVETEMPVNALSLMALRKLVLLASDVLDVRTSSSKENQADSAVTESDSA
ncbi:IFI44-like protein [Mya arenaria]|uniref:IFI44-like protein n=1 Tax=Mya arenaria TaxID=6604 RepID=A0ABY7G750_MYAAR|nr:interferon-induced protein 44-like [Mya arenaria]XP_052786777.1 interferon-induced protein 44-like [Mya arenaria]XP_052786778.1 interferon-induced protein 44-like [Mya arenaria]WAR29762.1 IFI44-like protein [Mya arenaria]